MKFECFHFVPLEATSGTSTTCMVEKDNEILQKTVQFIISMNVKMINHLQNIVMNIYLFICLVINEWCSILLIIILQSCFINKANCELYLLFANFKHIVSLWNLLDKRLWNVTEWIDALWFHSTRGLCWRHVIITLTSHHHKQSLNRAGPEPCWSLMTLWDVSVVGNNGNVFQNRKWWQGNYRNGLILSGIHA